MDVITFGSPCQDLSVAGKRAGLKHETNGDKETTRSGLFMEAVRIITEMRRATNGKYPRYAVWENVPGAFSSNKGEDFRIVLEELIKIIEPAAEMPPAPKGGWPYADAYLGDGFSLAYRTFDAQYWGVPQRRRRIYLVADFAGGRAPGILFEREGLRGHFAEGRTPWQRTAGASQVRSGADGPKSSIKTFIIDNIGGQAEYGKESQVNGTLRAGAHGAVAYCFENHSQDTRYKGPLDTAQTVSATFGMGGNNQPFVVEPKFQTYQKVSGPLMANSHPGSYTGQDAFNDMLVAGKEEKPVAIDRAFFNQGQNALYDPQCYTDGTVPTLVARGPAAVAVRYIVRRLTPTECARLQGFADRWGDIDQKEDFAEEEYRFWLDVRNTHAEINGRAVKEYTKEQMLKWYNKLHSKSAEYKMWGNCVALPPTLYVMQGIAEAAPREDAA